MDFISEHRIDTGLLERRFALDGAPGILWTPTEPAEPRPIILLGHPGGLEPMYDRLLARARSAADQGFASATIELPGSGQRPRLPELEQARADLRRALADGGPDDDVIDRLVLPLVERAVPEWQHALDHLLALPGLDGRVGISGGVIALGVRMAVVEPRIRAAGLFAGSFVPRSIVEDAPRVTVPVHVLLQWDDEGNDRSAALALFDALGSKEKTLYASLGGHRGVPEHAGQDAARFFARHLGSVAGPGGQSGT